MAELKDIVSGWWRSLDYNRGERAELRRCSTTGDVAFCSGYLRLRLELHKAEVWYPSDWLAALAGVLSHVRQDAPDERAPRQLAAPKNGKATLGDLRFRRILAASTPDELMGLLTQAVHVAGDRINVVDLAYSIRAFGSEPDEKRKREWAFDYYEVAPRETAARG